jgi:hypothetical protein
MSAESLSEQEALFERARIEVQLHVSRFIR